MEANKHSVDTDQDVDERSRLPQRAWQDKKAGRDEIRPETISDSVFEDGREKRQQNEDVTSSGVSCPVTGKEDRDSLIDGLNGNVHSKDASENLKNTLESVDVHSNTLVNNSDGASTTKHRRELPTWPRETRASQLRCKSHSVTEMNSPHKSNVRRQNSLKSEKPTSPVSWPGKGTSLPNALLPNALRSQSTSSDDSSERDRMEAHPAPNAGETLKSALPSASRVKMRDSDSLPTNQNRGKGSSHDCFSIYTPSEKYLTPLQQKERLNKDLSMQISKLEQTVSCKEDRIRQFEEEKQHALEELGKAKDTEMGKLLIEMKNLQMHLQESKKSLLEVSEALNDQQKMSTSLKEQIEAMQRESEEREALHQKRYLEMYQKGREAQLIDQEEDLVCMAIAKAPNGDGQTRHLVKKLEKTEQELEKLRQTFREDVYHKTPQLDTDSAAQVEILKSAVYYYLSDIQPEVNLNVMLSMLNYSDVQKRNIISHLKKKLK